MIRKILEKFADKFVYSKCAESTGTVLNVGLFENIFIFIFKMNFLK